MPRGWPDAQAEPKFSIGRWFGQQFAEIKALAGGDMHFPTMGGGSGAAWWYSGQPRELVNYSAFVGDGSGTSIVEPVVRWIGRNVPGAPIRVRQIIEAGETNELPFHALPELIDAPNDYYDGKTLIKATAIDLSIDGNGYWWAIPSEAAASRPAQLWWIPHTMIEPKWNAADDQTFITHYEYRPGGTARYEIPPEQIIHFRDGIDPSNTRKGMSGLKSVLREVYTDEEASRYTSTILGNLGVPGAVIAPVGDKPVTPNDAEKAKERFIDSTSGRNRGKPIVFGQPVALTTFGFSPEQMSLKDLRRVPEERISAVLGVPAIVAGLGAGLDRSTFANYAEAREAGYEECIIPLQGLIAGTLRRRLLPAFEDDIKGYEVYFDTSDVRILQEDANRLAERMRTLVNGSILKRAEGRRELGYDATEDDEVYLVPINIVEVRPGEEREEPPPEEQPAPESTPEQVGT